jgi:uncharacterized protein
MTDELLQGYPHPSGRAVTKELTELDKHCRAFIELSPFAVLSTATPDGEPDVSPRGGLPGFVRVIDGTRLMLPDRVGNNRLDSLRKVAVNPRVCLLFFVPGVDETLRVYGRAELLDAVAAPAVAAERGRAPRSVLVLHVDRAFFHCAKALMRSRLWDPESRIPRESFPTMGQIMRDHAGGSGPVEDQQSMLDRYSAQL